MHLSGFAFACEKYQKNRYTTFDRQSGEKTANLEGKTTQPSRKTKNDQFSFNNNTYIFFDNIQITEVGNQEDRQTETKLSLERVSRNKWRSLPG